MKKKLISSERSYSANRQKAKIRASPHIRDYTRDLVSNIGQGYIFLKS